MRDHWPHFADLIDAVNDLDGRTVTVTQPTTAPTPDEVAEEYRKHQRRNGLV